MKTSDRSECADVVDVCSTQTALRTAMLCLWTNAKGRSKEKSSSECGKEAYEQPDGVGGVSLGKATGASQRIGVHRAREVGDVTVARG